MPLDLVTVLRVDSLETSKQGVWSHTITARTIEGNPRTVQYQTCNDWRASFCKESIKPKRQLWVTWRSSDFRSKDLTYVEPDRTAWRHE